MPRLRPFPLLASAALILLSAPLDAAAAADGGGCLPVLDPNLEARQSPLPMVLITTCGQPLAPRSEVPVAFALYAPPAEGGPARVSGAPSATGTWRARLIGHSSMTMPKRHIAITLEKPAALLGLPAAARWVLHGPMADKTLVRNAVVYDWARSLGLGSPRTTPIQLFVHEADGAIRAGDSRGLYYLMEWVEPGPDRLPIAPGGFLFRRDKGGPDDPAVVTSHGEKVLVDWPPAAPEEQRAALKQRLDRVEALLFGKAPLAELEPVLDVASFVDDALLVEVTKNADGFKWSTFFHFRDGAGPLRAGPPFDYDAALRNDKVAVDPTGWQHRFPRKEKDRSAWLPELWRRPELVQRFADRYAELRGGLLETSRALDAIDDHVRALGTAAAENYEASTALDERLLTNPDAAGTYALEVERMKNWLELRLEWLDQQFVAAPQAGKEREREVLAPEGEVFFAPGAQRGAIPSKKAELQSAPSEALVASFPASEVECGLGFSHRVEGMPPAADGLRISTRAPPASEFGISISGVG
ncbi:MAG TPA: CotH kinase family protein, partial [Myxococcales bacterium]|nr:CotH kinase family protein [Myxococcales bacterium]